MVSPGGSLTASFDQAVSWVSRLLTDHVYRVSSSGTHCVSTLRLENAGCASSAAGGASTTSAYDVSSTSWLLVPRFVSKTRRTSASSSGDTSTWSVVPTAPSRRTISARSSENVTS